MMAALSRQAHVTLPMNIEMRNVVECEKAERKR